MYDRLKKVLEREVSSLHDVDYVAVLEELACDIEGRLDAKREEMGAEDSIGDRDDW